MNMVCSSMPRKSLRRVICFSNEGASSKVGVACRSNAPRACSLPKVSVRYEERLQVHVGVWREAGGYFLLPGQEVWIEKHHVGNIGLPRPYRGDERPAPEPFPNTPPT